jgi:hypothetical protein
MTIGRSHMMSGPEVSRRALVVGLASLLPGVIHSARRSAQGNEAAATEHQHGFQSPAIEDGSKWADPRAFGALFDGITDDTDAWQKAIDVAARKQIPVMAAGGGTSLIKCKAVPNGTYGGDPSVRVFRALDINHSNLTIDLAGSRLRLIGQGASNAVNYAFGTAKNMRPRALSNIKVRNGILDFDPTGDPSANKRAFYFVGIKGIYLEDLLLTSSGRRAGATITLQNCQAVRIRNLTARNVTQGMNLSYVDDVLLDTLMFDTFREAIDCDRAVTALVARNLAFRNGGPSNQCIDLNSVMDVHISDVWAENVGNIALINYKTTTPPTFADWVNDRPVTAYLPSRNVVIERVRGDRICSPQSTTIPFRIGNDQKLARESLYHLENITLRDVVLTNCPSYIPIELVRNALLENVTIEGAVNPADSMGCIDIRSDFKGTATSATLRNVRVVMGPGASRGIKANAPAFVKLKDVTVAGASRMGASFFDFTSLDQNRARLEFDRVKAIATSGNSAVAYRFGDAGARGYDYSILWNPQNSEVGGFSRRFIMNGEAAQHIKLKPSAARK